MSWIFSSTKQASFMGRGALPWMGKFGDRTCGSSEGEASTWHARCPISTAPRSTSEPWYLKLPLFGDIPLINSLKCQTAVFHPFRSILPDGFRVVDFWGGTSRATRPFHDIFSWQHLQGLAPQPPHDGDLQLGWGQNYYNMQPQYVHFTRSLKQ